MKILTIFTLMLIPCLIISQTQWQDNGKPVYCGENVNWTGTTLNSSDGNVVMIWSDSRNGDRGIFAQKITPDGNLLWGEEGIEINDDLDTQHFPVATTNVNNEIIIAWVNHYGNFEAEIRVQKIDALGNKLWQNEGILLFTDYEIFPYRIKLIDDSVGGTFVVWRNYSFETPITVKGLHVLADGSIDSNWNVSGNILIQHLQQNEFDILSDGLGGFMFTWRNLDDLHIQRIGSNGNPLWGDAGIVLCEETMCNDHIGVVSDNNGLFYFFWKDSRNPNPNTIYMQKVDINGTALFPEDILIYTTDNNLSRIDAIDTTDGNLAVSWTEYDNPQFMIQTLKLDTFGNLLFDTINIFNSVYYECYNISIISDNNGGYWMKWLYSCNDQELYVQYINEYGTITLNNNGLFICEAMQDLSLSTINLTSDNRAFLSWSDKSTGNINLYVQVVDEVGNLQFPEDELYIYGGSFGYTYDLEVFPNEDNPIFIWINNSGKSRIFAQLINSDGSLIFGENGIPITPLFSNSQVNFATNIPSWSNEIAIVWEVNEEGYKQIHSQAIDFEGNYLWSNNYGVIVGQSSAQQEMPKISSINNVGTHEYYIGWHDFTDYMDSQIKGQKIINGNLQWGEEGKVIVDREGNDELTDIVENYYIWRYNSENICCLMVDENGDPAPGWPENGLDVCIAEGTHSQARGIIIPQGLLILWKDRRDGSSGIYGQIITEEGNALWQQDGIPLVAQSGGQMYFNFQFDDYFYLVWQDYRSGDNYEIYAQKFDENGNELWQVGGILISEGQKPDIVKIGDRLIIVWENSEEYNFSDIHAQLIDLDGNLLWYPDGIVLCDASWDQRNPQIVTNQSNDVYIAWLDNRIFNYDPYAGFCATSVFSQKIHIEPTFSPDDILNAITAKLHQNYPNPFNPSTTISFELNTENTEVTELTIYNLKGQKIKSFTNDHLTNSPVNQIIWDGKDDNGKSVSSGIYFYKLKSGDFEKSRKMLLLK